MEFNKYVRKPFVVEAVEVTEENIKELAPLIGQFRRKHDDKSPYIRVNPNQVPNVTAVFPGYFITKLGDQVRAYNPKVFKREFIEANDKVVELVAELDGVEEVTS